MNKLILAAAASAACLQFSGASAALVPSADAKTLSVQEVRAKTFQPYRVSRKAFLEFRGEYMLNNGASLRLSKHGRHFYAEVTGQAKIEVRATSPNTFVAIAGDTELVFEQHSNGLVSRVLLKQPAKG